MCHISPEAFFVVAFSIVLLSVMIVINMGCTFFFQMPNGTWKKWTSDDLFILGVCFIGATENIARLFNWLEYYYEPAQYLWWIFPCLAVGAFCVYTLPMIWLNYCWGADNTHEVLALLVVVFWLMVIGISAAGVPYALILYRPSM
jgi:hypothetical protein